MAIPVVEITDHDVQAKARLPGWLISSTNLRLFYDVLMGSIQTVEGLFIELLNETSLGTAVGVQLDVIGTILGLARTSATEPDEEYRTRLFGQSAALAQSGEPEAVIQAWQLIWTADSVFLTELQPATIELTAFLTTDPDDSDLDVAAEAAMEKVVAAGVGAILQLAVEPVFLWGAEADADAAGDIPANTTGFGDDADADGNGDILPGVGGGNLARVLV